MIKGAYQYSIGTDGDAEDVFPGYLPGDDNYVRLAGF